MAEVFTPAGSSDVTSELRDFLQNRGQNYTLKSMEMDPTRYVSSDTAGALAMPLRNLIVVELDPFWYAVHKAKWKSPLGSRLPVTFIENEDGLSETVSVAYADVEVVGRAENFKTYMGASNRELPITFQFRAQGLSGLDRQATIRKEVMDPYRWLDALNYPIESGGVSYPPPTLFVTIGELISMRCIATAISTRFLPAIDPLTYLPMGIDVSVTFVSVADRLGNYNFEGPNRFTPTLEGVDGPETAFGTTKNQY